MNAETKKTSQNVPEKSVEKTEKKPKQKDTQPAKGQKEGVQKIYVPKQQSVKPELEKVEKKETPVTEPKKQE